jgi:hypothetical protein
MQATEETIPYPHCEAPYLGEAAYLDCALWAELDWEADEPRPLSDTYEPHQIAVEFRLKAHAELVRFWAAAWADLKAAGYTDPAQVAHDLWLTRNHHGTGFWDRGLGEIGERLTKLADQLGEADVYASDGFVSCD